MNKKWTKWGIKTYQVPLLYFGHTSRYLAHHSFGPGASVVGVKKLEIFALVGWRQRYASKQHISSFLLGKYFLQSIRIPGRTSNFKIKIQEISKPKLTNSHIIVTLFWKMELFGILKFIVVFYLEHLPSLRFKSKSI